MTYDGTQYSYHGQCDLVLARSPEFGSGLGLDIHARTEIVNNWSLISNAAVRIGEDTLELRNDNTHYFNGVEGVELPIAMSGKYIVSKGETTINHESDENGDARTDLIVEYTIDLENGESIKISNYRSMIAVNVNAFLSGTEGMLGKLHMKGMIGRDGDTAFEDPNQMGAQWQVRDTEPMLFHEVRAPQYPESCTLPSTMGRSLRQSTKDLKVAEEACRNVSVDMIQFCIDDVVMTGDVNIAAGYGHYKFGSSF
jgi:hypothetical protein